MDDDDLPPGFGSTRFEGVADVDLFRATFDLSPIGAALFELDGTLVEANEALRAIAGHPQPPLRSVTDAVFPEDLADVTGWFRRMVSGDAHPVAREQRLRRAGGDSAWVRMTARTIPRPDGRPALVLAHVVDITLERDVATELRRRADHDPLTGLVTRDVLLGALADAVDHARETKSLLGVLYLDLDRFKQVNDRFGHEAGDLLLVHAARAITSAVRPGDIVSRLGGDEFVVVLRSIRSEQEATVVAERVRLAVGGPVRLTANAQLDASVSVGVALSHGFTTADALLRDADAALYQAKEQGRDRVGVFDEDLRAKAVQRLSTELVLRQSLEVGGMVLRFEPVVDVSSGRLVGAETRVGVAGADADRLPVGEVLAIAEETGLVHALGSAAVDRTCAALGRWSGQEEGVAGWLGLDVTASQIIHPGYAERLADALAEHGNDPSRFRVEIPAPVVVGGPSYLGDAIDCIREVGVKVVLDGVGVDLASLAAMDALPVDAVKVDLAALPDIVTNPAAATVVGSVARVAEEVGVELIASGVDRPEQVEALDALRYRQMQGQAVAPVLGIDDLVAWDHRH